MSTFQGFPASPIDGVPLMMSSVHDSMLQPVAGAYCRNAQRASPTQTARGRKPRPLAIEANLRCRFVVIDAFALPVEGTETRVNAQAEAYEYMVDFAETNKASAPSLLSLKKRGDPGLGYCVAQAEAYEYMVDLAETNKVLLGALRGRRPCPCRTFGASWDHPVAFRTLRAVANAQLPCMLLHLQL